MKVKIATLLLLMISSFALAQNNIVKEYDMSKFNGLLFGRQGTRTHFKLQASNDGLLKIVRRCYAGFGIGSSENLVLDDESVLKKYSDCCLIKAAGEAPPPPPPGGSSTLLTSSPQDFISVQTWYEKDITGCKISLDSLDSKNDIAILTIECDAENSKALIFNVVLFPVHNAVELRENRFIINRQRNKKR